MISAKSVINLNLPKIKQLTDAQITALEQTAEALHTEVVQAQVFPRDTGHLQNENTFLDRSEKQFPARPMPAACISIRNIISAREPIQMLGANGVRIGFLAAVKLILQPKHSKKFTGD